MTHHNRVVFFSCRTEISSPERDDASSSLSTVDELDDAWQRQATDDNHAGGGELAVVECTTHAYETVERLEAVTSLQQQHDSDEHDDSGSDDGADSPAAAAERLEIVEEKDEDDMKQQQQRNVENETETSGNSQDSESGDDDSSHDNNNTNKVKADDASPSNSGDSAANELRLEDSDSNNKPKDSVDSSQVTSPPPSHACGDETEPISHQTSSGSDTSVPLASSVNVKESSPVSDNDTKPDDSEPVVTAVVETDSVNIETAELVIENRLGDVNTDSSVVKDSQNSDVIAVTSSDNVASECATTDTTSSSSSQQQQPPSSAMSELADTTSTDDAVEETTDAVASSASADAVVDASESSSSPSAAAAAVTSESMNMQHMDCQTEDDPEIMAMCDSYSEMCDNDASGFVDAQTHQMYVDGDGVQVMRPSGADAKDDDISNGNGDDTSTDEFDEARDDVTSPPHANRHDDNDDDDDDDDDFSTDSGDAKTSSVTSQLQKKGRHHHRGGGAGVAPSSPVTCDTTAE